VTRHQDPEHVIRAITPVPPADRPARFQPWPNDVKERCRELWASHGNRNSGRVEWLYGREVPEDTAIPASVTIRGWARDDDWESWANGELIRTRGKTLHQLQTTWLRSLQLSQEVQIDAMLGRFAENPADGAIRVKAAESVQRIVAQAGLLAVLPSEPETSSEAERHLSLPERARRMRERIVAGNNED
jgi:hypothetical protein